MTKLRINREGKIKLFLSISVLLYSFYVSVVTMNIEPAIAMIFSCMGDINIMASRGALTEKKEESFNSGVMFFAFAHFVYISSMGKMPLPMVITLIACVLIYILNNLKPNGNKLVYIPYIVALFTSAINAWFFSYIAGIGMILFLISDGVLSVCEEKNPKWQIVIWMTYIPAQILMLTALLLN